MIRKPRYINDDDYGIIMMIKITIADLRTLPLSESCERLLGSLPAEERKRAERYLREEDRIRCAAGAFLMQKSVKNALAERGAEPVFGIVRTKYGKPYVKEYPDIQLSLSHSGDIIALAQYDREIGVDVEQINNIEIDGYMSFMTAGEQRLIKNAPDPLVCFYRVWTVREAFSKQVGLGLPIFESEKVAIDYEHERIAYRGKTYSVKTFSLDGHIMSVCVCGNMPEIRRHFIDKTEWESFFTLP